MKNKCPQCSFKFGFRGPKYEIVRHRKTFRKKMRYFCPSCSVELYYAPPILERALLITGNVSLFLGSLINIYRVSTNSNATLIWISLVFFSVGIVGHTGGVFLMFMRQHYKIKDQSKPLNTPDANSAILNSEKP